MKLAVAAVLLIAVVFYVSAEDSPAEEKRRGWGKRSWGKRADDDDRVSLLPLLKKRETVVPLY